MYSKPIVTIAIPTYNRVRYLKQAVESVLTQTYTNFEIIIADNASVDGTEEIMKSIDDKRVKYFRHPENTGQVRNWNFCLNKAGGEYFIMLSDDDIIEKEAISWFVSKFEDPRVVLAYSKVLFINSDSVPFGLSQTSPSIETGKDFIYGSLTEGRMIYPSATMHRTDVARLIGGYPDIGTTTDLAMRLSIAQAGIVVYSEAPLVRYRIHDTALSNSGDKVAQSFEQLIAWSKKHGSPLYDWNDLVRKYSVKYVEKIARSQAIRGNRDSMLRIIETLKKIEPTWHNEITLEFLGLAPVRMLGMLRRKFRKTLSKLRY